MDILYESEEWKKRFLRRLFEVAANVSVKLRAVLEASTAEDVGPRQNGGNWYYERLSPAQEEALFSLFQEELRILAGSREFELLKSQYTKLTQAERISGPSSACVLDCRAEKLFSGILVGSSNRVAWFDPSLKLDVPEGGIWVRNIPLPLLLSLMIGIGLTIYYVVQRANKAEVEDVIQTALSILALYVSTVVVIVYRLFHNGEKVSDVLSFKQYIDTVSEWDCLTEEERSELLVCLLQRHPSGKPFVRCKHASFVREASPSGCFILAGPTALENLMVAGFQVLKKDGKLRLRAADGALADMVPVMSCGNKLYEAKWWNSETMAAEGGDTTWKPTQNSKGMYIQ